jgi:hypothetical protein
MAELQMKQTRTAPRAVTLSNFKLKWASHMPSPLPPRTLVEQQIMLQKCGTCRRTSPAMQPVAGGLQPPHD